MRSLFNRFLTRRLLMPLCFALGGVMLMLLASQPEAVSADDPMFSDSGEVLSDTKSTSVAVADLDGDGDLDLFVATGSQNENSAQSQANEVWWNDGNGNFVDSGQRLGNSDSSSVALGDLDGDGDIDAFVTNGQPVVIGQGVPNRVWLNDGTGHFFTDDEPQMPNELDSTDVALGDLDGDGDLDAFVTNIGVYNHPENEIWLNNGDATFTKGENVGISLSSAVALADLDDDGDLDAFVTESRLCTKFACAGSKPNKVYLNDGTASFTLNQNVGDSDSGDVALGDLDGDGDVDAFVSNGNMATEGGAPNKVWLNDGTGTFTETQALGNLLSLGVALADLDGDRDLDAFVANYPGDVTQSQNEVWLNDGTAHFTDGGLLETGRSTAVALADVDADSDLDAVVANIGPNKIWLNHIEPFFAGETVNDLHGWNGAQGDFDGDHDLDVLLLVSSDAGSRLLLNDGLGNFSEDSQLLPFFTHLAVGDLDGDHDLDLFAALGGNEPNQVWLNDGSGQFSDSAQSLGGSSSLFVALGDVDADGDLDAFVANENQANHVWLNDGAGNFSESNQSLGTADSRAIVLGDMDDDGDLDAVVANANSNQVWLNDGLGFFSAGVSFDSLSSYAIALGDVEGDGDLDVFVANDNTGNKIWLNDGSGHLSTSQTLGSSNGRGISLGDLDGDGDLDAVLALRGQSDEAYLNDGDGHFEQAQSLGEAVVSKKALLGDFNADGALDAFMLHPDLPNQLYLNKAGDATRFQVDVQKPGATQDTDLYSTAEILDQNIIPITYTLYHPLSATIGSVEGFYSFDGGDNWHQALATSDTMLTNLATAAHPSSTPTNTHLFKWDTFASGFFGQSDNVVFRIVAYPPQQGKEIEGTYYYTNTASAPYLWPSAASTTYPFRVRGTQIRVLSDTVPVEGAKIYRLPNGQTDEAELMTNDAGEPFLSNPQGYLIGRGALGVGDKLVAMLPISSTGSFTMPVGSMLYHTSATPTTTGLEMYQIDAPGVQTLIVSAERPLLLFDLDISLQWDSRSDELYLQQLRLDLERASEILYDLTNGQVALGKLSIYHAKENWRKSDIVIHANNNLRPGADLGGVTDRPVKEILANTQVITNAYVPGKIHMSAIWNRFGHPGGEVGEDWPRTLAHELGHYLLFVPDNYLGLSENGLLAKVDCIGSAMTDPYREDYSELLARSEWTGDCLQTLAELTTARTDWETVSAFYDFLDDSGGNSGPTNLPLDVTQLTFVEPEEPSNTLIDPFFNVTDEDTNPLPLPFGSAQGYLIKTQGTEELTDDEIIALGSPINDLLRTRGAEAGDRLCLFDYSYNPRRLGCIDQISPSSTNLSLYEVPDWQPQITVNSVTSRTLAISVRQSIPSGELYVQIFPHLNPTSTLEAAPVATLIPISADTFSQTITLEYPIASGFVRIWTEEAPLREEMTGFFISGGWGPSSSDDGWGPSSSDDGWGANRRRWNAPISSTDGQVTIFDLDHIFGGNPIYTLQSLSTPPNLPLWLTSVGQAYRFSAAQPLTGTLNIMFEYMQRQVPDDDLEEELQIYYSPDEGQSWQPLMTELDSYRNLASAQIPAEGIYTLISTIKRPLTPGWNLFYYPVNETRAITTALASIDGYYNSVYLYKSWPLPANWFLYDTTITNQQAEFTSYVNDLTHLEAGQGYFIYATEPITLYLGVGNTNNGAQALMTEERAASSFTPPATFYGWVTATDSFTPTVDMAVTAHVNGTQCGETSIVELAGKLAYKLQVTDAGTCGTGNILFQVDNHIYEGEVPWDNSQAWFHSLPSEEEKATLNACVTLQGRPSSPDSRLSVPLDVTLTAQGESSPTYSFSPTTDEEGCFSLTEIDVGSYEIRVKKSSSLQNMQHISLVGGENNIDVGTLREGDANNDNFVTILDFSILAAAFGKCEGTAGYDQRADFNGDSCITILDFSLLASNFGQAGGQTQGIAPTTPSRLTHPSTQEVALIIEPAITTVARGELFTVSVQIQAGNQLVDGAQIKLHFDPAMLEVQEVMTEGRDQTLPLALMNQFDNKAGTIEVAAGTLDDYPKGEIEVAQLQFKALTSTDSSPLSIIKEESNVTFGGNSVLGEQTDALITISQPTSISLITTSSAPHRANPLLALIALAIVVAGFVVRRVVR